MTVDPERRATTQRRRISIVAKAALVAAVIALGACGSDSSTSGAPARVLDVTMKDIAFEPNAVTVHAGERTKFVFHNTGKIDHDAYIGTEHMQMEHEDAMSGGGMHHATDDAITVMPGKTGSLTHTFKSGETVVIGCHQPGHYAGGMKITVSVD